MNFIYSILNKVNGKIYVGLTSQGRERFNKHKSLLNNGNHFNPHLQSAWDKYGADAFEFNVLEYCSKDKLNENEDWWIEFFGSTNPDIGYNLRSGGGANFTVLESTRKKLSDINRGENHWNYGKHHSNTTRKRISESMKKIESPMHRQEVCDKVAETRIKKYNSTGYYRVSKQMKSDCKQGFYWRYQWREDGKKKTLNSVDFDKLKEKVVSRGLLWGKISDVCEETS